ncbi:MAG TPA: GDSL-type esterase/lipase family protein [Humisphaera sp.]|nr:GDSL-type esterase/lipase family protein [Humisphaera sp.]
MPRRSMLIVLALAAFAVAASPSDKYEKEIAAFEAADRAAPPAPGGIVFVGDSGFRMWKSLDTDIPDMKIINRGFGGSTMADALYFTDRIVLPYKPHLIVVREGGNDLSTGTTPDQLIAEFQTFVDKVRAKLPETRIVFCLLNPNPTRWSQADTRKKTNAMIKEFVAKGKNLDYIEVWDQFLGPDGKPRTDLFLPDGLHNNAKGYAIYAEAVKPHLK